MMTMTATSLALGKYSNQYGERWEAGDVIGTGIDSDYGSVEFYHNSQSMDKKYKRCMSEVDTVDKCRRWHPAVSFTLEQELAFLGTDIKDKMLLLATVLHLLF
ncbi:hypothetical protein BX661DRAFT_226204 [Kickxella alabastrina]|uniref:uncharacterized protein n=1 Tax=Kickxella alabastrina TaxID=61397 RepID=UPI00222057C5|nr:uncharacterized protein BX661DRAFT_226204 [Kickxella alabastrina]KAI7823462.1 hypothetical protein BX661DRAFT_226204 [Kickxella alabastrina]